MICEVLFPSATFVLVPANTFSSPRLRNDVPAIVIRTKRIGTHCDTTASNALEPPATVTVDETVAERRPVATVRVTEGVRVRLGKAVTTVRDTVCVRLAKPVATVAEGVRVRLDKAVTTVRVTDGV